MKFLLISGEELTSELEKQSDGDSLVFEGYRFNIYKSQQKLSFHPKYHEEKHIPASVLARSILIHKGHINFLLYKNSEDKYMFFPVLTSSQFHSQKRYQEFQYKDIDLQREYDTCPSIDVSWFDLAMHRLRKKIYESNGKQLIDISDFQNINLPNAQTTQTTRSNVTTQTIPTNTQTAGNQPPIQYQPTLFVNAPVMLPDLFSVNSVNGMVRQFKLPHENYRYFKFQGFHYLYFDNVATKQRDVVLVFDVHQIARMTTNHEIDPNLVKEFKRQSTEALVMANTNNLIPYHPRQINSQTSPLLTGNLSYYPSYLRQEGENLIQSVSATTITQSGFSIYHFGYVPFILKENPDATIDIDLLLKPNQLPLISVNDKINWGKIDELKNELVTYVSAWVANSRSQQQSVEAVPSPPTTPILTPYDLTSFYEDTDPTTNPPSETQRRPSK